MLLSYEIIKQMISVVWWQMAPSFIVDDMVFHEYLEVDLSLCEGFKFVTAKIDIISMQR